jgi:transcription-repair coupling factor (superfamily II helicase)
LSQRTLKIICGEDYAQNKIVRTLLCAGYVRSDIVDGIGQFSVRGGILDIFPPSYTQPVRIEFWGDTVDSISLFDAENQRRTQTLDSVDITPATAWDTPILRSIAARNAPLIIMSIKYSRAASAM